MTPKDVKRLARSRAECEIRHGLDNLEQEVPDTVASILWQYEQHLMRRNMRPNYVYAQKGTLRRLARFVYPSELTTTTDKVLLAYLDSRKLSPGARAVEISHFRSFFSWAVEEEVIRLDPARRLVKPRQPRPLPRPMPDADIIHALAEAPCRVAAILNFAVYAGLRACEIAQLRADDIGETIILVRESKGGSPSTVPVAPQLAAALERCPLPTRGWLFPRVDGTPGHISRNRVCQLANVYLHEIGIAHTLHTLRHAFLSHVYQATHDLRLTQELARHQSVQSTVGYTRLWPSQGAAAVALIPTFG